MRLQQLLIPVSFSIGERVEIAESAPGNITGFGRIECECRARPGWYYVRFPQAELELFQWVYIMKAPQL